MCPLFQKIKSKSSLEKPIEELSFTLNKRKNGVIYFGLFHCLLSLSPIQLFYDPMDCNPPLSSVHGIFQGRWWSVAFLFPRDLPDQGSYLHLLHWQANSLPLSCLESTSVEMLSLQSCPTLCKHMDCSPPGFSVHGILQARILEWVAISFYISVDIKYQIYIIIHKTQREANLG